MHVVQLCVACIDLALYPLPQGYFAKTRLLKEFTRQCKDRDGEDSEMPMTFCDSVTGRPLFIAPVGRTRQDFVQESRLHGWPVY